MCPATSLSQLRLGDLGEQECPRDFEVFVYGGCACIVRMYTVYLCRPGESGRSLELELEKVVSYRDAGKKTHVLCKSSHYSAIPPSVTSQLSPALHAKIGSQSRKVLGF